MKFKRNFSCSKGLLLADGSCYAGGRSCEDSCQHFSKKSSIISIPDFVLELKDSYGKVEVYVEEEILNYKVLYNEKVLKNMAELGEKFAADVIKKIPDGNYSFRVIYCGRQETAFRVEVKDSSIEVKKKTYDHTEIPSIGYQDCWH